MVVTKSIPCSPWDIRGMQEWLDEMALQGLFLEKFSRHWDRAVFEVREPRPVRYRLDPVGKSKKKDRERAELYQEAGWTRVTTISKVFHIFSCQDPDAPELYSDPQSLSIAMGDLLRRQIINTVWLAISFLFLAALPLLMYPRSLLQNILLWEKPRDLFFSLFYPIFLIASLPFLAKEVKKLTKIRDTLAQGLPLKAGRRWNRPRYSTMFILVYCILWFGPRLFLPDVRWQVHGLEDMTPARPWPTLVQLEEAGPRPLTEEPEVDGYLTFNHSWFVPVQEFRSMDWEVRSFDPFTGEDTVLDRPYPLSVTVQYDQARSPKTARLVYQLRRDQEAQELKAALSYDNPLSYVSHLQPFEQREYPGLDSLETVRFRRGGADSWLFTALRGNDVLVVEYCGPAEPEDCLPLFLEALDKEVPP